VEIVVSLATGNETLHAIASGDVRVILSRMDPEMGRGWVERQPGRLFLLTVNFQVKRPLCLFCCKVIVSRSFLLSEFIDIHVLPLIGSLRRLWRLVSILLVIYFLLLRTLLAFFPFLFPNCFSYEHSVL